VFLSITPPTAMTQKTVHEFRDPIHGFIHVDTDERRVIDSPPVQRLRHIHQLATTYLVYPGATHRRFEHSLGVMELAGRVFDIVTAPDNLHPSVRELFPEIKRDDSRLYWRRVVRMGALCHDLGRVVTARRSREEWARITQNMIDRGPAAPPEQVQTIVIYLTAQFGREGE